MKRELVAAIAAFLLASCHRQAPVMTMVALAHDPDRLMALRGQCRTNPAQVAAVWCRMADDAYRERFFLGLGGADEYQTLSELPPIPASFDGAADKGAQP
jgi:hypothetical protein